MRRHLGSHRQSFDSELFETFADLDATRHIVVHNRGIVDDSYVRAVRNPPFGLGEFRVIGDTSVDRFAHVTLEVAELIRRVDFAR